VCIKHDLLHRVGIIGNIVHDLAMRVKRLVMRSNPCVWCLQCFHGGSRGMVAVYHGILLKDGVWWYVFTVQNLLQYLCLHRVAHVIRLHNTILHIYSLELS